MNDIDRIDTAVFRCKCDPLARDGCVHRLSRKLTGERDETRRWVRFPPKTGLAADVIDVMPAGQIAQRCERHGTLLHENGSDQRVRLDQHHYPRPVCFQCLEEEPDNALHELTLHLMGRGAGRPPKEPTEGSLNPSDWTHLLKVYPDDDPALVYKALLDVCRRADRPREPDRWVPKALAREVSSRATAARAKEDQRPDKALSRLGPTASVVEYPEEMSERAREQQRAWEKKYELGWAPGRSARRVNLSDRLYSSGGSAESPYVDDVG